MAGETPWTKGPWKVERDTVVVCPDGGSLAEVRPCSILVDYPYPQAANARLIAAAPEMADIIERSVWALDAFRRGDVENYPDFDKWDADCRALLARIHGGQHEQ